MTDILSVQGISTMRALPRGLVSRFLASGVPLPEAIARLAPCAVFTSRVHNLVVDSGKALVADLILDVESIGLTYHAIGTGSAAPNVGNTALGTESNRKTWTSKIRTGPVITLTEFYLAAESTFNIQECGVFGGASASATPGSGKLFSRYLQAYDNSAGLVDLTFEYELTIG